MSESGNHTELTVDVHNELIQRERSELPEHPSRMTFRGRYKHVDSALVKLLGTDTLKKFGKVNFLDYAGGVLHFGSPTVHDLIDLLKGIEVKVNATVVDKFIPDNLVPNYSEVKYLLPQERPLTEKYDLVRLLRLIEHISKDEYNEIRESLIPQIREGGIFITSQILYYFKDFGEREMRQSPIIKIMQKQDGVLVPISILPDTVVPFVTDLDTYAVFRQDVQNRNKGIKIIMHDEDLRGAKYLINRNIEMGVKALDFEYSQVASKHEATMPGDISKILELNASKAHEYFQSGAML
jgi:hypothetical protein